MTLNRAEVIGHLGADPDVRSFPDGGKIANLSVATTRKWRDKQSGDVREETEWHRVSIQSEGLAGVVEKYLRKGSKVYVAGRLRTRKWKDQSGADRYTTEIVVTGFDGMLEMLGDPRGTGGDDRAAAQRPGTGSAAPPAQGDTGRDMIDDEIPF